MPFRRDRIPPVPPPQWPTYRPTASWSVGVQWTSVHPLIGTRFKTYAQTAWTQHQMKNWENYAFTWTGNGSAEKKCAFFAIEFIVKSSLLLVNTIIVVIVIVCCYCCSCCYCYWLLLLFTFYTNLFYPAFTVLPNLKRTRIHRPCYKPKWLPKIMHSAWTILF